MKKLLVATVITTLVLSFCNGESWWKKLANKVDSIDQQKIEKKINDFHEGFVEGLEDAEKDITAPKEEQSTFARIFNYIADLDVSSQPGVGVEVNPENFERVGAYTHAR